ncbi:alpha/beta fold hydrolase [Acidisoma silvae]|uniref:Alpha/beta hydrolase n=1 Tax=Acidisoma silvae TaxID=2802396 RepID=A0A963YWG6_9PROT|nr:alpha/beta hydrolase [Acidisoma silvae]MCB8878421.1 alpha/beta hydrolase [Acidisoma silvae]
MKLHPRPAFSFATVLAASATTLAVLAAANHLMARRTERTYSPEGKFMEVDGLRLHFTDRGAGRPVVLIHGNMVCGNDFDTSGVAEILRHSHRVIIFDRPGFGYSSRPNDRIWTADQQAQLLSKALQQLDVVRPVIVGHSWGTIVALAMAARDQTAIAGLVLVSGYYVKTIRLDTLTAAVATLPVIGTILRHTISPFVSWLTMPMTKKALFWPARVPKRFDEKFSTAMALRPSQIKAMSQDGALMIPSVIALAEHYAKLELPIALIAGAGDKVVFKSNSEKLEQAVEGSALVVVSDAGHMVHYQAAQQVAEAVGTIIHKAATRFAT